MILLFFSRGLDVNESIKELNFELEEISKWAFTQKMQFNPDPNKQANQVIFSRKSKVYSYPPLTFNNNVKKYPHQKHLGIILDSKITRLKSALLIIYKSFTRPHLDYGDIIYDKPENFQNKLGKIQSKSMSCDNWCNSRDLNRWH